ncbi:hypothetical protein B0H16DRAFT_1469038 [Mycena metata]|uniref:Uncharacterized protein n=1 Tax=Mycena metata TaxID=1033252 RepID=A0AAD7MSU2_9AGAR|nr:hypothetical protein B0H16DRAFT_1469038 [Mycena metata]
MDEERLLKASISLKLILEPRTNPRNDKNNSLDQKEPAQHTVGSRNYVPHKGVNYTGTKKRIGRSNLEVTAPRSKSRRKRNIDLIVRSIPSWSNPASAASTDIQSSARLTSTRPHPQVGPAKKMHPAALYASHPLLALHAGPAFKADSAGGKASRAPRPLHLCIPAKRKKKRGKKNSAGNEGRKEGGPKPASPGPRPRTKGERVKGKERKRDEGPRASRDEKPRRKKTRAPKRQPEESQPSPKRSPKRKEGQKGRKEVQTKERNSRENVPGTGTGTMSLPLGAVAVCAICGGVS